jgi:hypothetical protein
MSAFRILGLCGCLHFFCCNISHAAASFIVKPNEELPAGNFFSDYAAVSIPSRFAVFKVLCYGILAPIWSLRLL